MEEESVSYERLLDGISDGVYFMDRDRIIRYWNRGTERITGFKKEEVIGTACRDNVLRHVDDAGTILCPSELSDPRQSRGSLNFIHFLGRV
ncbi:MAG: PAS domain-containing protein [Desulfomonile tiedjei]|nr:PAS domain-containing protein [Desulfomonile tiedjei]